LKSLGAGGGIISMTLTYPLITIGTRMQTSHGKQTFTDSLLKTYKKEGIAGLYSGLDTAVFGIAVTNGVYYYWYEIAKKAFEKDGKLSIAESLLAGGLAGAATVLVTNPIWVLNTRLASGKGNKSIDEDSPSSSQEQLVKDQSAFDVLLSIIREEGVQSLWQGVWPALILVANPSIQYMAFEQLKQLMTDKWRALNSFDYFLLGAVSKLAATFITYPYM
jgi:adenine nucleotide transporter 17